MVQSRTRKVKAGNSGVKEGKTPEAGTQTDPAGIASAEDSRTQAITDTPNLVNPIYSDEALNLEEELSRAIANEAPADKVERTPPAIRKLARKEAEQTALVLLGLFDGLAVVMFGDQARLLDYERELISAPLQRIIERSNILNAEAVNKYSDPLLLVMGLIGWYTRVNREMKEKQPQEQPQEQPQASQPARPKNGEIPQEILAAEQLKPPQVFKEQMKGGAVNVKY